jgi:hypothetical protein
MKIKFEKWQGSLTDPYTWYVTITDNKGKVKRDKVYQRYDQFDKWKPQWWRNGKRVDKLFESLLESLFQQYMEGYECELWPFGEF